MSEEFGLNAPGVQEFVELPISEKHRLIQEWICSERDRYILTRRLIDGVSFLKLEEELAEDKRFIPIQYRQIQNVAAKGIKTLLKHIKSTYT